MNQNFHKKIFTARIFLNDIGFLITRLPMVIKALRNKKINRAFIEKIMMVTSVVNECTYCSWFHAKQAVASGVSEEEIKNMLNLQFQSDANDFETMALLYAQHYAETNRTPDEEMTKKLFDFYGEKTAKQIILFIRIIFFGNLCGNTWDAVLSRLKGKPAENSSIMFEFIFFSLLVWFMIPIMLISGEVKKH